MEMSKINVRNTMSAETIIDNPEEISVAEAFRKAGIEIGTGTVNINGINVNGDRFDSTIADIAGVKETYTVAAIVKSDNA